MQQTVSLPSGFSPAGMASPATCPVSDELSTSSALKVLLGPADFVCIPIMKLEWNGQKMISPLETEVLLWGKIRSVPIGKAYFFLCDFWVYFFFSAVYYK